jgi:hypothetical protein
LYEYNRGFEEEETSTKYQKSYLPLSLVCVRKNKTLPQKSESGGEMG